MASSLHATADVHNEAAFDFRGDGWIAFSCLIAQHSPALIMKPSVSLKPLPTAAEKKMTVVDYFLLLPPKFFERPPADWLDFLRQPKSGVFDIANGYMRCSGDGAQPRFQVALFRYRDWRSLLAVCQSELEGPDSVFLDFFERGSDGKMEKTKRSIFPMGDAGNDKGNWRFELPRTAGPCSCETRRLEKSFVNSFGTAKSLSKINR